MQIAPVLDARRTSILRHEGICSKKRVQAYPPGYRTLGGIRATDKCDFPSRLRTDLDVFRPNAESAPREILYVGRKKATSGNHHCKSRGSGYGFRVKS